MNKELFEINGRFINVQHIAIARLHSAAEVGLTQDKLELVMVGPSGPVANQLFYGDEAHTVARYLYGHATPLRVRASEPGEYPVPRTKTE